MSVANAGSDPDSFGRPVRYLDLGLSATIYNRIGNPPCPAGAICHSVTSLSTPYTFTDNNVVTIDLPAASTNSMVCFAVTPFISYSLIAPSTASVVARMSWRMDVTIDSDVLDDPSLINPVTGQPFNGSIAIAGLSSYSTQKTLAAAAVDQQTMQYSRECQYGVISRTGLQSVYGLTAAQAQSVLSGPMTLRFSVVHTGTYASQVVTRTGVRLFGD